MSHEKKKHVCIRGEILPNTTRITRSHTIRITEPQPTRIPWVDVTGPTGLACWIDHTLEDWNSWTPLSQLLVELLVQVAPDIFVEKVQGSSFGAFSRAVVFWGETE